MNPRTRWCNSSLTSSVATSTGSTFTSTAVTTVAIERTIGGTKNVCPGANSPANASPPNPVELTESLNGPAGTLENENCPLSPDTTSRKKDWVSEVSCTFAPAATEPDWSRIVPTMLPRLSLTCDAGC